MEHVIEALALSHHGVFTRKQAVAAGIDPRRLSRLARTGAIARIKRGVYSATGRIASLAEPWAITRSHEVVLSFWSAVAWWGVDLARPLRRVHVTAPRDRKIRRDAIPGVRVHRAALSAYDVRVVQGVRVSSPLRTCLDIARHASLEDAVVVVDGFFRRKLLSYEAFVAAARAAKGPGRMRMQVVADLVDPKSGSVLESLARVLLWRNGLRPPATQHLLEHRASGWRGYLDFAWPDLKVALECDGYEWHSERQPFENDRRRWSTLNRLDWKSGVVTWFNVVEDPVYVVSLVADLLGRPVPCPIRHTNVGREARVA